LSRNRLPLDKATTSGAALKNPARYASRPRTAGRPIGEPYSQMTPAQQDAWRELVAEMPWLNSAHRTLLRLACIIVARLDQADVGVNQIQTLSAILSKLGATPVDEAKAPRADDDDADPADRFFERHN
jgi:hypothetical protein